MLTEVTDIHILVVLLSIRCRNGMFLCMAVSSPEDCSKPFTLYFPGRLFNETPSQPLWKVPTTLQLMREGFSYKYPPVSIARYSFIQLSELEQCRMNIFAQGLTPQHRLRTRVLLARVRSSTPELLTLRINSPLAELQSNRLHGKWQWVRVVITQDEP